MTEIQKNTDENLAEVEKEVVSKLNGLLKTTHDATAGYKFASESVSNESLKAFFELSSTQRDNYAKQLTIVIEAGDYEATDDGTFAGAIHQTWMKVREAININDERVILLECIRGEESALSDYDEIMQDKTVANSVKAVVSSQRVQIVKDLATMQKLESTLA